MNLLSLLPIAQAAAPAAENDPDVLVRVADISQQAIDSITHFLVAYGLNIVGALIILIAGSMLAKFVSKRIEKLILRSKSADPSVAAISRKVTYIALMVIVAIVVLGNFGVETASLIAVLGTAGLAIGLALQGTLSNIAAGVMILLLKPFKAGQAIKFGGSDVYLIDEVGLFVTRAHMPDCPRVMIPNSQIWGSTIINFSDTDKGLRRFDIIFGIAYSDDIGKAIDILQTLAKSDSRIVADPAPFIKVESLGDSSVNIMFRVHTSASVWWDSKLELTKAGKEALEAGGMTIPFPQRDVWLRQAEGTKAL